MTPRTPSPTVPEALDRLLAGDSARPLVTFYDDATGERVELSVTTFANWVAKTCGFVVDTLGLERGDRVRVTLPTHWLTGVWLTAAWSCGLEVTDADDADLLVCGPGGWEAPAGSVGSAGSVREVVACSLLPLGARFRDPLPAGVWDFAAEALAQPDVFVPVDAPEGDDLAWSVAGAALAQVDLLTHPDAAWTGRLLTDAGPATPAGLGGLTGPLTGDASVVWVAHADPDGWARRAEAERTTRTLRITDL